jgi:hypothetical protein
VLGINFDSETLTWSLGADKEAGIQCLINEFLEKSTCTLLEAQKLHGKLSDFSLSCDFMLGFRFHLVELLGKFGAEGNPEERRFVSLALKDDLWVWKKAVATARLGLPLRDVTDLPPIDVLTFVSDAAGASLEWINGESRNTTISGDRGAAAVRYKGEHIAWVGEVRWPDRLMKGQKNRKGKYFGSKSTTLETVGLLIPIIMEPRTLLGQYIILEVDNIAVVYAWRKKYCGNDPETSLLIRCLHVLEAFLECKIYVRHLRRMSNPIASIADGLTRKATMTTELMETIGDVPWRTLEGPLADWLNDPVLDWDLPLKIVKYVQTLL